MISEEVAMKKYEHWKLIGTLLWGCAILFIVQMLTAVITAIIKASDYSEMAITAAIKNIGQDGLLASIYTILMMIFGVLAIYAAIKLKKNSNLTDYLAFNKVNYQSIIRWSCMTLGYVILVNAIGLLFGRPIVGEFMSTIYKTASPILLLWVALIIAAPVFEELFFRGFLFKGLVNSPLGLLGTVIFTAAAWALIHVQYDYFDIGAIFIGGLFLGYARFKSDSILVPIAMHSTANLIAVIQAEIFR